MTNNNSRIKQGTLKLRAIVDRYGLDMKDLASVLFPSVRYPEKALVRILSGEAQLDAGQIVTLAEYVGVPISELFESDDWKGITEEGCLTMIKGPYKIRLAYKGAFLTIYKNNHIVKQCISNYGIVVMPVYDFIEHINNLIKNLENGNN